MLGIRKHRGIAIDLWQGDITTFACDAIVNAANPQLAGGGGVDGAIHRVGGPSLLEECRQIGGCAVGGAVLTGAGDLPARWVIHAVGPIWRGGGEKEAELLASAYSQSLTVACQAGVAHIAFPSISTGVYGFPVEMAAPVAIGAFINFIDRWSEMSHVWQSATLLRRLSMVLFSAADYDVYQRAMFDMIPDLP